MLISHIFHALPTTGPVRSACLEYVGKAKSTTLKWSTWIHTGLAIGLHLIVDCTEPGSRTHLDCYSLF